MSGNANRRSGIANRYHIWGPKWQKLPFEGGNFGSNDESRIRHFGFEISWLQLIFELKSKRLIAPCERTIFFA